MSASRVRRSSLLLVGAMIIFSSLGARGADAGDLDLTAADPGADQTTEAVAETTATITQTTDQTTEAVAEAASDGQLTAVSQTAASMDAVALDPDGSSTPAAGGGTPGEPSAASVDGSYAGGPSSGGTSPQFIRKRGGVETFSPRSGVRTRDPGAGTNGLDRGASGPAPNDRRCQDGRTILCLLEALYRRGSAVAGAVGEIFRALAGTGVGLMPPLGGALLAAALGGALLWNSRHAGAHDSSG